MKSRLSNLTTLALLLTEEQQHHPQPLPASTQHPEKQGAQQPTATAYEDCGSS